MNARAVAALAAVSMLAALLWWPGAQAHQPASDGQEIQAYLPLTLLGIAASDLPRPPTAEATETPAATATPSDTPAAPSQTPLPSTDTPTPTDTPEPTAVPETGTIAGRYTEYGEPLPAGYGADGLPQIELLRCAGGECTVVDTAVSQDGGGFEFVNPPALEPGEAYQVLWDNEPGLSYDGFLHRWWSRRVTAFGDGTDVELGDMEIGNLVLSAPCHDCGLSLPITFQWEPRPPRSEVYRWSLFRACGVYEERPNAYHTESLGHIGEYTLRNPPRGFRLDEKYCWFIQIEDGQRGNGWSYYDWRVTFLSVP